MELEPRHATEFLQVAAAALAEGKAKMAEAAAEVAVQCDPNLQAAWSALGAARAKLNSFAEAVPCYVRALELEPSDVAAWCSLGELYISLLDYTKAAEALKQCMLLDPKAEHPSGIRARLVVINTLKMLKQ